MIHQFTNLMANDKRLAFFGNVRLGTDVQLEELRARYHSVVLAYGAESDRHLNVPGEVGLGGGGGTYFGLHTSA